MDSFSHFSLQNFTHPSMIVSDKRVKGDLWVDTMGFEQL
jgi:hypothetical protein